jgi:hypothetical protein
MAICEWTTAELLDRWHTRTHRGKGDMADQRTPGRMVLGRACKEGISRMKNVLIDRFGERKLCF